MLEQFRILIIDDRPADRALVATLLRDELTGVELREVSGAVEFAELLGRRAWTVAIAERALAWADGVELLRAVKQRHPHCRTILFAREAPDELGPLGAAGIDAYVRKDSAGYLRLPQLVRATRATVPTAAGDDRPRLRGDLAEVPVGYFRVLADGTILEANAALATLLAVGDPDALAARSLLELLPSETERTRCERSLARGARETFVPVEVAPLEGPPIACTVSFWPVPDEQGRACLEGLLWRAEARAPAPLPPERTEPASTVAEDGSALASSAVEDAGSAAPPEPAAEPPAPSESVPERSVVTPIRPSIEPDARMPLGPAVGPTELPARAEDSLELSLEPQALEPVPLKEAVLSAMESLRPLIAQSDARIRAARLPTLEANRSEMVRLFRELLENALKFRSDARPQISVRAEEHVDGWLISVRDNGAGIPAERRKTLFGRGTTDLEAHPGSGLAICQRIAKRYGGDVWLTSEPGQGTTIFVALKARATPSDRISLSVQFNGETMGEISVSNASNRREIARAALSLPRLKRNIGDQTIKYVQFVERGVVNIVA